MSITKSLLNIAGFTAAVCLPQLLWLLLICLPIFAEEITIEELEDQNRNKEEWQRIIAFGFDYNSGNSDTTLLNLKAKIDREKNKNIWIFELDQSYGEDDNQKNVDYTFATAEYKRLLSERWFAGAGIPSRRDAIADLEYRIIPNIVLGYFVLKSDYCRLGLELGPAYVVEKVGGLDDNYFAPRLGERFSYQLSKTAKIFQSFDYVVATDDTDKYQINFEAGIDAAITDLLSIILSVKNRYDNQPAEGAERNDLSFVTSLGIRF